MMPYNPITLAAMRKEQAESQPSSSTVTPPAAVTQDDDDKPYYSAVYFGYASNLSPMTMKQRCPDSLHIGFARLEGWRWVIDSSRFPNLVRSKGDVVYGTLSFLSNRDEAALDESEGVPREMQKKYLDVTRLGPDGKELPDDKGEKQTVRALTYLTETRTETDGTMMPDYAVLINKAIRDGLAGGVPTEYVDKYLRPFTPAGDEAEDITVIRSLKQFRVPNRPRAPGE